MFILFFLKYASAACLIKISSDNFLAYIFGAKDISNVAQYVPNTLETLVILGGEICNFGLFNYPYIKLVVLSDGITTIGKEGFYCCVQMKEIVLPKTITAIEENAFSSCNSLENVYFEGTLEEWNSINIARGNSCLLDSTIYIYSESNPTESGNYWHYVNGEIVIW